jgi:excisionase family DNA binding protein
MTIPPPDSAARKTRDGEVLVTLQEAAERLSVPKGTLYSWVSRHLLVPKGYGPGRKAMFSAAEVQALVDRSTRRRPRGAANA